MTRYEKCVVTGEFDEVLAKVREQIENAGFYVLCDIDLCAVFEERFGLDDHRRYRILGVCGPPSAEQDLEDDIFLGVLLPRKFVVYETDEGEVVVGAIDPHPVDSADVETAASADQVRGRLADVLRSVTMETEVLPD